ncbi:sensor histidine kinase [Diaphorobacter aerolatus]|uniref:histidine kinase n=1 Tax=Diaphorobacter aerolatus TaxID=1288495 RepID=A0A7H0GLI8_9BURK|nr:HAMP domain-containing sensor histidine kinase [Diaphorobacter aerolatus]QNP49154.1 HAMP domain-containing histidine kinase [Diaphorobacter aerolatus]
MSAQLEQLRRENAQLKAQDLAHVQLFAAAVHDLRQPLQAALFFSDALSGEALSPSQLNAAIRVRQSMEALDRLSAGMLDLTEMKANDLGPRTRPVELAPLLDDVGRRFDALARRRGLRLVVRPTDLSARGDVSILTRVLNNLVSNALHNTQNGGVLVGVRRETGGVRIDVCDTGEGLVRELQSPQAMAASVTERRLIDTKPAAEGCGLGLATVRHLAELLGARIGLRSGHGRGTTVSIHLAA